MEGIRHSISAHNAAVAAHLQAQQQQAHAQQQAAAAVAAQHRNNSLVWHQQQAAGNPTAAQLQNGFSNFMPSMMAMQANSMNQMAMVATAKLAPSKKNKASNSSLAVRSTVPRFNITGGVYTVAQWARKCVEDNLEFIIKITRRADPKADLVMLAYGDGCSTLVFLDDGMNKVPKDISKVPKIDVGVSAAAIDDKRDDSDMAASGVLQPSDSLWDHLRYEQASVTKEKKEKILYIHTCMTVYGGGVLGRQRVLQIKTKAPKSPFAGDCYMRNVMFEQQVLTQWKADLPPTIPQGLPSMGPGPVAPQAEAAVAPAAADEDTSPEYLITFNPKELLLLEKAFDNGLTPRDLKAKAEKWTDEDAKKCQMTIIRANNEFKYVRPRKPNRKKDAPAADKSEEAAEKKPASPKKASKAKEDDKKAKKESPKKARKSSVTKAKGATPKKSSVKKDSPPDVDSDDEPIVKLKSPAEKKKVTASTKKATPAKTKAAAKKATPAKKVTPVKKESPPKPKAAAKKVSAKKATTPAKVKADPAKKRGRDKSPAASFVKKTRSSSKPRSTRSKK